MLENKVHFHEHHNNCFIFIIFSICFRSLDRCSIILLSSMLQHICYPVIHFVSSHDPPPPPKYSVLRKANNEICQLEIYICKASTFATCLFIQHSLLLRTMSYWHWMLTHFLNTEGESRILHLQEQL